MNLAEPVAPQFQLDAFNCPYCNAYAHMDWTSLTVPGWTTRTAVARCRKCGKVSIWYVVRGTGPAGPGSGILVYPSMSHGPAAHPDLPEQCRQDYEEAREIFQRSPRAAAAMLRLCVQKLCAELGGAGHNINDDIKKLVAEGLPVGIQQALDVIRVVGNNAVHPGVMSEEDTVELGAALFKLINMIVENRITEPKNLAELFGRLPDGAKQAIVKRDAATK